MLHPVQEYTKMRIPEKRYQTNKVRTIWCTWSASALMYSILTISVGTARKFAIYNRNDGITNFKVLDMLMTLCICSQHRVFPLPWWYFTVPQERLSQSEHMVRDACTVLRVEVIIFSWGSGGLSLIERNLKKWIMFLHSR